MPAFQQNTDPEQSLGAVPGVETEAGRLGATAGFTRDVDRTGFFAAQRVAGAADTRYLARHIGLVLGKSIE